MSDGAFSRVTDKEVLQGGIVVWGLQSDCASLGKVRFIFGSVFEGYALLSTVPDTLPSV